MLLAEQYLLPYCFAIKLVNPQCSCSTRPVLDLQNKAHEIALALCKHMMVPDPLRRHSQRYDAALFPHQSSSTLDIVYAIATLLFKLQPQALAAGAAFFGAACNQVRHQEQV